MMRGFCSRGLCPEGAYVLMELCMEGVLSKGVLSGGGFVPDSISTHGGRRGVRGVHKFNLTIVLKY